MPYILMLHMLCAVALLGAVTHQALGVLAPVHAPAGTFFARYRAVNGANYVNAIVVLYLLTACLGMTVYPNYRIDARVVMEQLHFFKRVGSFELKEHLIALGLGLLPAYWWAWQPAQKDHRLARQGLTVVLAVFVWYAFIIGHFLVNTRGIE
jgi:hypothetical protein